MLTSRQQTETATARAAPVVVTAALCSCSFTTTLLKQPRTDRMGYECCWCGSTTIPRLTRTIAMSPSTLAALGGRLFLLQSHRGNLPPLHLHLNWHHPPPPPPSSSSSSSSSSPWFESTPRTHVATRIPITLIRARFVAEGGGGGGAGLWVRRGCRVCVLRVCVLRVCVLRVAAEFACDYPFVTWLWKVGPDPAVTLGRKGEVVRGGGVGWVRVAGGGGRAQAGMGCMCRCMSCASGWALAVGRQDQWQARLAPALELIIVY